MRSIFTTGIFCLLACTFLFGQTNEITYTNVDIKKYITETNKLNQTDSLGKKQGPWVYSGSLCRQWGWPNSTGEVFDSCMVCGIVVYKDDLLADTSYQFNRKGALVIIGIPFVSENQPTEIGYYESGHKRYERYSNYHPATKYHLLKETIMFSDSVPGCPVSKYCEDGTAVGYVDCVMNSRTSAMYRHFFNMEEPGQEHIPYAVEKGKFKKDRLYSGTISYYNEFDVLQKTIKVTNGKHVNDSTLVFRDQELLRQILNHTPRIDVDYSGTIEVSEAEMVTYLELRGYNLDGQRELRYFKNVKEFYDPSKDPFNGPAEMGIELNDPDAIVDFPDEFASFNGGQETWLAYLEKNLQYPETAKATEEQGKVYISFIVEKDGTVSNIEVLRGLSPEMNKEAIRLIKESPKWIPAKYQNEIVRSKVTMPVRFVLP